MKTTLEERFRKKMRKIGKKNRFCRFCIMPVMVLGMFCFHVVSYCKGNMKRFAMLSMTFLLFVVYSSFSFPMFVMGESSGTLNPVSEEAKNITLAEETEIDMEDFALLEDDDLLLDEEELQDLTYDVDMDAVEKYSAEDILEANQERIPAEKPEISVGDDVEFSKDDWRLILINKQHSIPEGYEADVPLGDINTLKGVMQCDERIIDDLLAMIQAAQDDGVTLLICSPYRDYEYQKMLFNRKINNYMNRGFSYMEAYQLASQAVTVPNASEHQIGLAIDFLTPSYMTLNEGFEDTAAGEWLAENSHEYGFILRYPRGKEYLTGIGYEPWHFRYVGVEAATVITENEITLEEFWEELE